MSALLLVLECLLAPLAAAALFVSFAFSRRRGLLAGLAEELPERLGGLSREARAKLSGRRVWWLHAASAGEVAGLAPLIEALRARPGAPALLVTTTTAYVASGEGKQTDVASTENALGDRTSMTHDAVGNVLTTTSPRGIVWPATPKAPAGRCAS